MKPKDMRYKKFSITFLNALSIFCAVSIIGLCVIVTREKKYRPEQQSLASRGVLSFFVTLAVFLIITAVLGCIGALRMNVRTLYVHACFYIFLISVEVIVGIGAVVISSLVGGGNELRVQFYKNTTVEEDTMKQESFWDNMQFQYHCCGVDGPQDYAVIQREIPASCCARAHPLREGGARRHLHSTCLTEHTYYKRGCEMVFGKQKTRIRNMCIAFTVMLVILELLITGTALCMARNIRRERRKLQQNLQAHFES